jgi:hypothetical protein
MDQELQQGQRRTIRPMKVINYENQWPLIGKENEGL